MISGDRDPQALLFRNRQFNFFNAADRASVPERPFVAKTGKIVGADKMRGGLLHFFHVERIGEMPGGMAEKRHLHSSMAKRIPVLFFPARKSGMKLEGHFFGAH